MCERHRELLDLYQKAVSRFSTTLIAITAAEDENEDYQRHYGYVEQTRKAAERARSQLQRHIAEHGCDRAIAASLGAKAGG